MRPIFRLSLLISLGIISPPLVAQPTATVRVPLCLQFPDDHRYTPCTGVVPADSTTGDALNWGDVFRGSQDKPNYSQESSRRAHWTETKTPLAASGTFPGSAHDDGSTAPSGSTKWSTFNCFAWADQTGTLSLQASDDGSNWITVQSQPWAASTSIYLVQPIFTKYWRCLVTNGSTAQGAFVVYSAFGI